MFFAGFCIVIFLHWTSPIFLHWTSLISSIGLSWKSGEVWTSSRRHHCIINDDDDEKYGENDDDGNYNNADDDNNNDDKKGMPDPGWRSCCWWPPPPLGQLTWQCTAMHRLTVQRNGSMHICKCSICMHARCESDMHIGAGCKGETLATPLVPMLTPLLTPWCTWSTSTRIFTGISTGALGDPPGAHLPHNLLNSHCHWRPPLWPPWPPATPKPGVFLVALVVSTLNASLKSLWHFGPIICIMSDPLSWRWWSFDRRHVQPNLGPATDIRVRVKCRLADYTLTMLVKKKITPWQSALLLSSSASLSLSSSSLSQSPNISGSLDTSFCCLWHCMYGGLIPALCYHRPRKMNMLVVRVLRQIGALYVYLSLSVYGVIWASV